MKVAQLQLEGSGVSLTVRIEDAETIIEHLKMAEAGNSFRIIIAELTSEQLASMPEFGGF